jgi:hypothetical protein
MNPFCQIEYVSSDSDVGRRAEPRFALIVRWSVTDNQSVNSVMTTTSCIHAVRKPVQNERNRYSVIVSLDKRPF